MCTIYYIFVCQVCIYICNILCDVGALVLTLGDCLSMYIYTYIFVHNCDILFYQFLFIQNILHHAIAIVLAVGNCLVMYLHRCVY